MTLDAAIKRYKREVYPHVVHDPDVLTYSWGLYCYHLQGQGLIQKRQADLWSRAIVVPTTEQEDEEVYCEC